MNVNHIKIKLKSVLLSMFLWFLYCYKCMLWDKKNKSQIKICQILLRSGIHHIKYSLKSYIWYPSYKIWLEKYIFISSLFFTLPNLLDYSCMFLFLFLVKDWTSYTFLKFPNVGFHISFSSFRMLYFIYLSRHSECELHITFSTFTMRKFTLFIFWHS